MDSAAGGGDLPKVNKCVLKNTEHVLFLEDSGLFLFPIAGNEHTHRRTIRIFGFRPGANIDDKRRYDKGTEPSVK